MKEIRERLRLLKRVNTDTMYDARLIYLACYLNAEINVRVYRSVLEAENDWNFQYKADVRRRISSMASEIPFNRDRLLDTARQVFMARASTLIDIYGGAERYQTIMKMANVDDGAFDESEWYLLYTVGRAVLEDSAGNQTGSQGELEPSSANYFYKHEDEILSRLMQSDHLLKEEVDVLERKRHQYRVHFNRVNELIGRLMYGKQLEPLINGLVSISPDSGGTTTRIYFDYILNEMVESESQKKAFVNALGHFYESVRLQKEAERRANAEDDISIVPMRRLEHLLV